ncbi:hypothetical protein D8674_037509 [Pyrus ussuriensis x Pyrus communis]|uniref:Uncharacterized protein n=1 Tax=Pyrus ussuriensis x Pyrus communis TaxID=2448454 RepID=A0A5N5GG32_9ROSA|nr:hypothetical protein D8674_037509 [Pyrus ussuriensis x Pyrus communis]
MDARDSDSVNDDESVEIILAFSSHRDFKMAFAMLHMENSLVTYSTLINAKIKQRE